MLMLAMVAIRLEIFNIGVDLKRTRQEECDHGTKPTEIETCVDPDCSARMPRNRIPWRLLLKLCFLNRPTLRSDYKASAVCEMIAA